MDYGLVLISHATDKTFKNELGQEYNQIVPTLGSKPRNIVSRLCDIIGYSRTVTLENGENSTKLFMRGTPRYIAGSRFKYTPDYIDFNYKSLVSAIGDAIDKQAAEDGAEYFTDTKNNLYQETKLSFDDLLKQANEIINNIISSHEEEDFVTNYQPKITEIIERYLGKGQKINQCDRGQVEALSLIIDDLKELK